MSGPIGVALHIDQMKAMHSSGLTLQIIGDHFGVTRERVRQILKKHGVTRDQGGCAFRAVERAKAERRRKDAISLARNGMTYAEWRATPYATKAAFAHHRKSAGNRGIPFDLTLGDWIRLWGRSGKFHLRGHGGDLYCMARINDAGGYTIGNVKIITNRENAREYAKAKREGRREARATIIAGVYQLYPGSKRPYVVRYGRKLIGYFRSEKRAIAARQRFEAKLQAKRESAQCAQ
jgi:hypothetical protein